MPYSYIQSFALGPLFPCGFSIFMPVSINKPNGKFWKGLRYSHPCHPMLFGTSWKAFFRTLRNGDDTLTGSVVETGNAPKEGFVKIFRPCWSRRLVADAFNVKRKIAPSGNDVHPRLTMRALRAYCIALPDQCFAKTIFDVRIGYE